MIYLSHTHMHTYISYQIVQKLQMLPNNNTIIPDKNNNILILCNVQAMIKLPQLLPKCLALHLDNFLN